MNYILTYKADGSFAEAVQALRDRGIDITREFRLLQTVVSPNADEYRDQIGPDWVIEEEHTVSTRITAPFTPEQVKGLNEFQHSWMHPFTCGGEYCHRGEREDDGILIARETGWVCPCGKYTQDWAHAFMADGAPPNPFQDFLDKEDT